MSSDLTLSYTVEQDRQQVFDAINDVRGWWGEVVGDTTTVGAEWVYAVADIHFSKFRTTALVPGERVEWLVVDSHLSFIEDKQEWTGTTVRFEIQEESGPDGPTRLTFTHVGLSPEQECFGVCDTAWRQYVLGSLRNLIRTGVGTPGDFSNQESLDAALAGTVQSPQV